MKQFLLFTAISVLLFSCTPMKNVVYFSQGEALATNELSNPKKRRLQEGDVLHVKILGVQEEAFNLFNIENNASNQQTTTANLFMNGFTIGSNGEIEIPSLGNIYVKSLTIEEAKEKIQTRANEFLIGATIIVKHINFEVTILGEVNRPGTYTIYKDNLTVLEAIGLAGDLTDFAARNQIKLIRGTEIEQINLTSKELLLSENFYLKADDVLYVEPISSVRMRNSKAQIYFSAISSMALIANIVLRSFGFY